MKVTVNREELLEKLKAKLAEDDVTPSEAAMKNFQDKYKKLGIKSAISALKNGEGFDLYVSSGWDSYNKRQGEGYVKVEFILPIAISEIPPQPSSGLSGNDREALQKAITVLEMSVDEKLTISQQDNYFRFI